MSDTIINVTVHLCQSLNLHGNMLREARRAVRVWKPKRLVMDSQTVIGDAGYGSEENYQYWERQKIEAVIKYGTHRKEQSRKWKEYPWNRGGCG